MGVNMSIRSTGKKYTKEDKSERFVIGAWSKPKLGKTHLGFTAPEPIFLFNLDKGEEGTIDKFADKEIYYEDYLVDGDASPKKKGQILERLAKDYFSTLSNENTGTIMIDSFTQVWDLVYSSKLEQVLNNKGRSEPMPFDYSDANEVAEGMVKAIYETNLNMYIIERATEKYNKNGQPTGNFKPKGYKGLPYLVQVFGRLTIENNQRYYKIRHNRFTDAATGEKHNVLDPDFSKIGKIAKEV